MHKGLSIDSDGMCPPFVLRYRHAGMNNGTCAPQENTRVRYDSIGEFNAQPGLGEPRKYGMAPASNAEAMKTNV